MKVDGEVVDCGRTLLTNILRHAWGAVQEQKACRFRADISRLILNLTDILRADFAGSKAGRSASSLKASIGIAREDEFDFDAMSRMLGKTAPRCQWRGGGASRRSTMRCSPRLAATAWIRGTWCASPII